MPTRQAGGGGNITEDGLCLFVSTDNHHAQERRRDTDLQRL